MKLVILESSNKTRTVSQYLSSEYLVLSSNGHINELAKTGEYKLGVDLKTFTPNFVIDQSKLPILNNLKKNAKQAEAIYLATDPDREGEAISYHLINYLQSVLSKNTKINRVVFNEVTKTAVLKGFAEPTVIDNNLVESQITRRILDRMIGFRLSKLLQEKIYAKSAGRVQSVALKLIISREKEIENFIAEKTWIISALLDSQYSVQLTKKKLSTAKKTVKLVIKTEKDLQKIKKEISHQFQVTGIIKKVQILSPPLPLKTATLVQIASSKFNFSIKKTMFLAQQLYEGVEINGKLMGLISYPRTDSQRVSTDFYQKASDFICQKYSQEFQGLKPSFKKQQKIKIQDAHESIHITGELLDLKLAQSVLTPELYKIYNLIYQYSFASLMTPAKVRVTKFELVNNNYYFELKCENLLFPGFLKLLYKDDLDNFNDQLPDWKIKSSLVAEKITEKLKISKPKPHLTEGTLIRTLEKLGIGRPSTYSTIVSKLTSNDYIEKKENKLLSKEMGVLVNKKLNLHFADLINEKYTSHLEKKLDTIASGEENRVAFLSAFWPIFDKQVERAKSKMIRDQGTKINRSCSECGSDLVEKQGRYGKFIACSGYPECKYIEKTPMPQVKIGRQCPQCKKEDLVEKQGRYGKFIACSGYPECKYIEKTPMPQVKIGRQCPQCKKEDLVEKQGRYGKFIACSGYPECKYIERTPMSQVKIGRQCPQCKKEDLVEKQGRYGKFIACSDYSCRYIEKSDKNF